MQRPSWTFCNSVYLPDKHCMIYRDDALGVQLQVEVKRDWTLIPPRERSYFFIDGVEKVFRTEDRLVRELRRTSFGRTHPLRSGGRPALLTHSSRCPDTD